MTLGRTLPKLMHFRPPFLSVPLVRDEDVRPLVPHQMRRLSIVLNDTLGGTYAYPSNVGVFEVVMRVGLSAEARTDAALHTPANKYPAVPSPRLQIFAVL